MKLDFSTTPIVMPETKMDFSACLNCPQQDDCNVSRFANEIWTDAHQELAKYSVVVSDILASIVGDFPLASEMFNSDIYKNALDELGTLQSIINNIYERVGKLVISAVNAVHQQTPIISKNGCDPVYLESVLADIAIENKDLSPEIDQQIVEDLGTDVIYYTSRGLCCALKLDVDKI